ncbi:MAG: hypothetical protein PUK70_08420 [Bacteroidales bacterium]|nr:hypothetical protein [Bacteroidales bacterium]MDY6000738.1 hypothetical protein [Candidatus Cryptobacteroides sp.]
METEALRTVIRSNRNRLEIEMAELLLDIMAKMEVETVSLCLNEIIPLLVCSQVKVEKSQVRKVVLECWKLTSAPNGLTYTTYLYGGNDRYQTLRSVGMYHTVTKGLLEKLLNSVELLNKDIKYWNIRICNLNKPPTTHNG